MSKFDGDGRQKIEATKPRRGTWPMAVTRASARRCIAAFLEKGISHHSGRGGMLWVIEEYCRENGIPYRVTGRKGFGYEAVRVVDMKRLGRYENFRFVISRDVPRR